VSQSTKEIAIEMVHEAVKTTSDNVTLLQDPAIDIEGASTNVLRPTTKRKEIILSEKFYKHMW
jgi:hypothetical protein